MSDQSYIGIDTTDTNEWIVVIWAHGKIIFSRPFKNTPTELDALAHFITERCTRPKICLNPAALKLISLISNIPDVEIMLLSNAGLRMYQAWLPKAIAATPFAQNNPCQAYLLAYCAERLV